MSVFAFLVFIVHSMKGVNWSSSRGNFTIYGVEWWKSSIEIIIHIYNRTFDFETLFGSKER